MARSKGTYSLSSNIEPSFSAPLDSRLVISTLADLTTANTFQYAYNGMTVYVNETKESYVLIDATDTTNFSNWKKVGADEVVAFNEVSPTELPHEVGTFIRYNNVTYKVIATIAVNDVLTIGTNISTSLGLKEGTTIWSPDNFSYGGAENIIQCFSEEEQIIGCWTDGKPLYQKVLAIQNETEDTTGRQTIDLTSLSIDKVTAMQGYTISSNNKYNRPMPFMYRSENSDAVTESMCIYYDLTTKMLNIPYRALNYGYGEIILQYTKTTDQPGSGPRLSSSETAHHYTFTEQIIGTWVNGDPIYERVIQLNVLRPGVNYVEEWYFDCSVIAQLISIHGAAYSPIYDQWVPLPHIDLSSGFSIEVKILKSEGKLKITVGNNEQWVLSDGYLVIQYTKTTN